MNTTRSEKSQFVIDLMEALDVSRLSEEEAVALKDLAESAIDGSLVDAGLEIDGCEYRLISDRSIREIAQEEIWDTISECYLHGAADRDGNLPWWIEIDEEKTVQNVIDSDGYANHFATYDGDEREVQAGEGLVHIFRTN